MGVSPAYIAPAATARRRCLPPAGDHAQRPLAPSAAASVGRWCCAARRAERGGQCRASQRRSGGAASAGVASRRAAARPRRRPRSASSCSGSRRLSSRATSPRRSRATTQAESLDVTLLDGGPTSPRRSVGSRPTAPSSRSLGPEGAPGARGGQLRPRRHRADLPALRHAVGVLEGHATSPRPQDFKGKKVGVWDFGNEFEVTAGAQQAGPRPQGDRLHEVHPGLQHDACCSGKQIDVAEAMIYNEYAQMLEAKNPDTGELVPADRPQRHQLERRRHGDAPGRPVRPRSRGSPQAGNEDIAIKFLRASFQGWIYCRDHPDDCIQYIVDAGSPARRRPPAWMMNEINPLIWPSPNGIGIMDPAPGTRPSTSRSTASIIKAAPPEGAYRTDLATKALEGITDDTKGAAFKKGTVEVTPGGF